MRARDIAAFVALAWGGGLVWQHFPTDFAVSALRVLANLAVIGIGGALVVLAASLALGLALRVLRAIADAASGR